jgi:hypothetical protein
MFKWLKKLFSIKYVCPVCEDTFETSRGRDIHIGNKKEDMHIMYKHNKLIREMNG